ncbi:MAG: hypothetical protein WCY34_01795 [Candidatus Omnitrophota bacterium]|jgi:uncharacterized membrane protein
MQISDKRLVKFVKKYPRISFLGLCLVLGLLLVMPISFKEKVLVVLRALVVGLGVSIALYFLKAKRKHD